ncbi:MAG: molybdopterin molybdotransferase MoeA [Desulfatiglandaceae bacterium]
MESFFKLVTCERAREHLEIFGPTGSEFVGLDEALDRVCSEDVTAPEDLPGFPRATMDGYAVRARDTFGATESLPAFFELCGEVEMGKAADLSVEQGRAARISTGGMLPRGADAVVMIEYCHPLDTHTIEITRAVSVLENVIQVGDDVSRDAVVLSVGRRLTPQDIGFCAGLGITGVNVFKKPKIGIISAGDEIIPADQPVEPGKVRDINRYTLAAFCRRHGAMPHFYGICPDRFEPFRECVVRAVGESDSVWLSGGSSVGTRDLTLQVLESLPDFELLVHGVSIKPGKPTIIGSCSGKPVIGLPGQVSSALVVAEILLTPLLKLLTGRTGNQKIPRGFIEAELSRNLESGGGREDYVGVRLHEDKGILTAEPVFGKSGLISTLVEADGLIRIPLNSEGLYAGQKVVVRLFDR